MRGHGEASVYFIRLGKYLKVGCSYNPERRFKNLFSSSTNYAAPWDCSKARADRELLGHVPGYLDQERRAHRALEMFDVGCEFFLAEPLALDYVDRCLRAQRVIKKPVVRPEGQSTWVGQHKPDPDANAKLRAVLSSGFFGGAA